MRHTFLPYFNPHSFRNTLVQLGQDVCNSPEEFKAWSQNLGHEKVLTTFINYGEVEYQRQGARQILRNEPRQKIAILSVMDSEQVIHEALKAGARAYISKSDGAKALIAAIEALQENRTYFNSRVGEIVLNGFLNTRKMPSQKAPVLPDLTAREREIVQLLAEGKSTKEVAVTLGVSVKTAETHRSNLMHKLGLHCVNWCYTPSAIISFKFRASRFPAQVAILAA